jgi:hypothetical protein
MAMALMNEAENDGSFAGRHFRLAFPRPCVIPLAPDTALKDATSLDRFFGSRSVAGAHIEGTSYACKTADRHPAGASDPNRGDSKNARADAEGKTTVCLRRRFAPALSRQHVGLEKI